MEKKKPYFVRLFAGRMNRQNYIIGTTLLSIPPALCFLIIAYDVVAVIATSIPTLDLNHPERLTVPQFSLNKLLVTPANELWFLLGVIFFLLSLPYLFSMQIRRQHDLNLSAGWWVINIVPIVQFYTYVPHTLAVPGSTLWLALSTISMLSSIVSLYFTVWAGTKGPNKYGPETVARTSMKKDVLLLE